MDDRASIWLDLAQAAALLGLSAPRMARLVDDGVLPVRLAPSGTRGVFKHELLAWHRRDQEARRAALVALAVSIDREVFR